MESRIGISRFIFFFSLLFSISYLRGVLSPFGTEAELGIFWGESDFCQTKGRPVHIGHEKRGSKCERAFLVRDVGLSLNTDAQRASSEAYFLFCFLLDFFDLLLFSFCFWCLKWRSSVVFLWGHLKRGNG